ncbi:MAG: hypothetical protein RLZZ568_1151 [Cyanobacteriota bacterium]
MEQTWCYPLADWGLIALQGADRQRFLHNQSTNAIAGRSPGQWLETVFVTSTGRTLELATVYVQPESVWIQVSAKQVDPLLAWMDRFIFPFDQVELKNLSHQYQAMIFGGETAGKLLEDWGLTLPTGDRWLTLTWQESEIIILPSTGLDFPGYTLVYPADKHAVLATHWQACPSLNDLQWETLRIQQGRPQAGHELTEDYNPLEAGLWRAVSFDKGCYIGQETIARLNTYKGVKQRLWGIKFDQPVPVGSTILREGQKVGVVTSISPLMPWGLGYLKTKLVEPGMGVEVEGVRGTVAPTPYLYHGYPDA